MKSPGHGTGRRAPAAARRALQQHPRSPPRDPGRLGRAGRRRCAWQKAQPPLAGLPRSKRRRCVRAGRPAGRPRRGPAPACRTPGCWVLRVDPRSGLPSVGRSRAAPQEPWLLPNRGQQCGQQPELLLAVSWGSWQPWQLAVSTLHGPRAGIVERAPAASIATCSASNFATGSPRTRLRPACLRRPTLPPTLRCSLAPEPHTHNQGTKP